LIVTGQNCIFDDYGNTVTFPSSSVLFPPAVGSLWNVKDTRIVQVIETVTVSYCKLGGEVTFRVLWDPRKEGKISVGNTMTVGTSTFYCAYKAVPLNPLELGRLWNELNSVIEAYKKHIGT
jgi:hypothetical protein